jgi:hypothetical protein
LARTSLEQVLWTSGHQLDASADGAVGVAALDGHSRPGGDRMRSKFGGDDDENRQRRDHDVSQRNGRWVEKRGTAAIRRMVPPQSGQMRKSQALLCRSRLA